MRFGLDIDAGIAGAGPGPLQGIELMTHVLELRSIGDTLRLDA
jgi:hypothetical protein